MVIHYLCFHCRRPEFIPGREPTSRQARGVSKSKDNKWRFTNDRSTGEVSPSPSAPLPQNQCTVAGPRLQRSPNHSPSTPSSKHVPPLWQGLGTQSPEGREVRWGGRGAQLCSQPSSSDSLVLGAVTASSMFSLKPEFWVSPLLTVSALAQSYAGHRYACQCGF